MDQKSRKARQEKGSPTKGTDRSALRASRASDALLVRLFGSPMGRSILDDAGWGHLAASVPLIRIGREQVVANPNSVIVRNLDTNVLWELNRIQLRDGDDTSESGAELMRRTNTSPLACRESNRRCAERRRVEGQAT